MCVWSNENEKKRSGSQQSVPDRAGGAYNANPDPLAAGKGSLLPS